LQLSRGLLACKTFTWGGIMLTSTLLN
jgi:hypothetical protein